MPDAPLTDPVRAQPAPLSADHAARIARLERLAHQLDSRFRLPGTKIRFGWDSILGLVPGVGDVVTLAPAAWIWLEAHRMGAPTGLKTRMAINSGVDWIVGSIPVVGDLFDVGIKANRRNVALLRAHFGLPEEFEAPR